MSASSICYHVCIWSCYGFELFYLFCYSPTGDVELTNMQLKPEALNALKLPVKVKAGFLGSVKIKVCEFSIITVHNHVSLWDFPSKLNGLVILLVLAILTLGRFWTKTYLSGREGDWSWIVNLKLSNLKGINVFELHGHWGPQWSGKCTAAGRQPYQYDVIDYSYNKSCSVTS